MEVFWSNLSLTVADQFQWKNLLCRNSQKRRTIFKDLSGRCRPEHVTAILGPSGCGKTSLLKAIAAKCLNEDSNNVVRSRSSNLTGSITIRNTEETEWFRKVAFIQQDDTLLGGLTVWETLWYASQLINHGRFSYTSEHAAQVKRVVDDLHLNSCVNSLVSCCSGGERRRLSVGMELLRRPAILIADEITSGLDSSSASMLIKLMNTVSRADVFFSSDSTVNRDDESIKTDERSYPMTIIMTIHQPSSRVFRMFDSIYLIGLAGLQGSTKHGACLYRGPPQGMVHALKDCHVTIPLYSNPVDTAMSIAVGNHGQDIIAQLYGKFSDAHLDDKMSDDEHQSCRSPSPTLSPLKRVSHFLHSVVYLLMVTILDNLRAPSQLVTLICFPIVIIFINEAGIGHFGRWTDCERPTDPEVEPNGTVLTFRLSAILSDNSNPVPAEVPPSMTAAFMLSLSTFFGYTIVTCFAVSDIRGAVQLVRRDVLNGRYTIGSHEASRMLWDAIRFGLAATMCTAANCLLAGFGLTSQEILELACTVMLFFMVSNEVGQVVALSVGLYSLNGATSLVTFLSATFCMSDFLSSRLLADSHSLDRPNLRMFLVHFNFIIDTPNVLSAIVHENSCGEDMANVTTNMVSEYDPARRHGYPYNHFAEENGHSFEMGCLLMGSTYLTLKAVSGFLLKLKTQI